ncbi:N-acetylglucosamine-6-phosphate deacetylase [Lysinibacillus fusiformis]|uniref:N-acetylglucosamine-6-phosphate deacetylase n=1 Tax=Lysinibacillus fusiformis TaxID=28031 RepID=UPI00215B149D|nr:N-acetylglucosamine-6-phosphate deacetylase [Lysinibacillus fusiformis]MCR8852308.1 N-acetylglucosamine-6-phosphate deacetylase [Lysinibacillus fusiformis]WKT78793.1 N-acetylglucosamine-6-phosphate deacetylase [Lysinibacillus fusiformis]
MSLIIRNITVVNASGRDEQMDVWMKDGKIAQIAQHIEAQGVEQLDGSGKFLLPGFIDMHIHGSAQMDTMDASDEGLHIMAKSLLKEGTTSFLATTMTQSFDNIERAITNVAQFQPKLDEAEVLGLHIEGPFVSKQRAGAQPLDYIVQPDIEVITKWQALSGQKIKQITLAPEEPNGMTAVQSLSENGIIVSIGHSDATFEQMQEAVQLGASQGTHLYNQMRPFHHRDPGVVGGVLLLDAIKAELIVDFIHMHEGAVEMAYRLKGADGIILITDAMRAKGMPYGEYDLGGQLVHVTESGAHLSNGSLAGSILTMDQAVRNMHQITNCTLEELVKMSSYNAAQQLKLTNKGQLIEGYDADAVIVDEHLLLHQTIKAGQINMHANN